MKMNPNYNGTRGFLLGDRLSISCLSNCSFYKIYLADNDKEVIRNTWYCSSSDTSSNCSTIVNMTLNGSNLECAFLKLKNDSNEEINSNYVGLLHLLVQGYLYVYMQYNDFIIIDSLDSVSHPLLNESADSLLNISWNPVSAYEGLDVYYNISLDIEMFDIVQSDTWLTYNTTAKDKCDLMSVSITPFINTTDEMLVGHTSQWDIPVEGESVRGILCIIYIIIAPFNDTLLNYTIILRESGSIYMNFTIVGIFL